MQMDIAHYQKKPFTNQIQSPNQRLGKLESQVTKSKTSTFVFGHAQRKKTPPTILLPINLPLRTLCLKKQRVRDKLCKTHILGPIRNWLTPDTRIMSHDTERTGLISGLQSPMLVFYSDKVLYSAFYSILALVMIIKDDPRQKREEMKKNTKRTKIKETRYIYIKEEYTDGMERELVEKDSPNSFKGFYFLTV